MSSPFFLNSFEKRKKIEREREREIAANSVRDRGSIEEEDRRLRGGRIDRRIQEGIVARRSHRVVRGQFSVVERTESLTAPPATRKLDAGRRVDSSPSVARSNAGVRGKRRDASVPDNPERAQTTRRNRCVHPTTTRQSLLSFPFFSFPSRFLFLFL